MKCTDADGVARTWKAGDAVWACAYALNAPKNAMALHQKPVRGMLLAGQYSDVHEDRVAHGDAMPRYFAPFKKNSVTEVMWSRVIPVASRDFADTESESTELYNMRVRQVIRWFEEKLESARLDLIS